MFPRRFRPIFALLSLLIPPAALAQTVDLRPKFEKGQEHRFTMEVSSATTTEMPQQEPQKITMKIETGLLLKVVDAPPEADATVQLIYETLKISQTTDRGIDEFDSAKPRDQDGNSIVGPALRPLVGTVLTLRIDPQGNIKSVTGGEGLMAEAGRLTQTGSVKQLIGPIFTSKQGNGQARIGESWENVDMIDSGALGQFKMVTRHTLKSATGSDAAVSFTGRFEKGSESALGSLFQITGGSYDGQYNWNPVRGMLQTMEATQKVMLEGDMGAGQIKVITEGTTKVKRADR